MIADLRDAREVCADERRTADETFALHFSVGFAQFAQVDGRQHRIVSEADGAEADAALLGHLHASERFALLERAESEGGACADRYGRQRALIERPFAVRRVCPYRGADDARAGEGIIARRTHAFKIGELCEGGVAVEGVRADRDLCGRGEHDFGERTAPCKRIVADRSDAGGNGEFCDVRSAERGRTDRGCLGGKRVGAVTGCRRRKQDHLIRGGEQQMSVRRNGIRRIALRHFERR